MGRLNGKTAVVTGAAQGLGRALAHRLSAEGVRVVIVDINADKAREAAAEITAVTGTDALGIGGDVTSAESCASMMGAATDAWGRLDILVANAGILKAGDIAEMDVSDFRRVVDVNLTGYFLSAQAAARAMRAQDPDGGSTRNHCPYQFEIWEKG